MKLTLPTDSEARKNVPVFSGVIKYAPAALAGMARISKAGNDKHNPGEPLHHARGKSNDHPDCIVRHAMDVADIEAAIVRVDDGSEWADAHPIREAQIEALLNEASQLLWRAALWSQELHEKFGGAPLAPGARLPSPAKDPNASRDIGSDFPQPLDINKGWADVNIKINPGDKITIGKPADGYGVVSKETRAAKQDAAFKKRQENY
jgi:hypothetical protein